MRVQVAATMALYISQENQDEVEKAINRLLAAGLFEGLFKESLSNSYYPSGQHESLLFRRLLKHRQGILVASQDQHLGLLLQMVRRHDIDEASIEALVKSGPMSQLQMMVQFVRKLDHKVVLVVDSMDESPTLILDQEPTTKTLRLGQLIK